MPEQYFVIENGRTIGPLSASELRQMAAQGRISPDTLVAKSANGPWVPARKVKGLTFPAPPIAPPPVPTLVTGVLPIARLATPVVHIPPATQETFLWSGRPSQITDLVFYIKCGVKCCVVISVLFALPQIEHLIASMQVVDELRQIETVSSFVRYGLLCYIAIQVGKSIWRWLCTRFESYDLTSQRFRKMSGVFSRRTEDIELYRVKDTSFDQPFFLRIFSLADIRIWSADASTHVASKFRKCDLIIEAIPAETAKHLREIIRTQVEEQREHKRVRQIELQ